MHNPTLVLIPGLDGTGRLFKLLIDLTSNRRSWIYPWVFAHINVRSTGNEWLVPAACFEPFKNGLTDIEQVKAQGGHFIVQTDPIGCWMVIKDLFAQV